MKAALKYLFLWIALMIVGCGVIIVICRVASLLIPGYTFNTRDLFADSLQGSVVQVIATQVLPIAVFLKRRYTSFSIDFKFSYGEGFSKKKLYLWAAVAGVGCLLFDIMVVMTFPVLDEWNLKIFGEDPDVNINFVDMISGCILAPLIEEAIFRGAIERRLLEKAWNPWFAIVISAIFFAIPHGSIYIFFSFFGLLVGWVYYRTGCVWPGIVIHAVNNILVLLPAFIDEVILGNDSFDDDLSLSLGVSIPLLIVSFTILAYSVWQIAVLTKNRTPIKAQQEPLDMMEFQD